MSYLEESKIVVDTVSRDAIEKRTEFRFERENDWSRAFLIFYKGLLPKTEKRKAITFSLTVFGELPKTLEDALLAAHFLSKEGNSLTSDDRSRLGGNIINRASKRDDNRRNGKWGYGRD